MTSSEFTDKPIETESTQLFNILRRHLEGNAARLKAFAMLVLGILSFGTVNLSTLSLAAAGETAQKSLYRRFQRFFEQFDFPAVQFGKMLLGMFPGEKNGLVLTMDRTNWKFGRKHINVLVIGVVFKGVAHPLVWKTLPPESKRGNSNTAARTGLMEKLLEIVQPSDIECLLADREFIGDDWLCWLDAKNIPFVIRLKGNLTLDGENVLDTAESGSWKNDPEKIYGSIGCPVRFCAKELSGEDDKWLLLIGNRHAGAELPALFKLRWGIECFFSHLKKKGFNFEDTHMYIADRIDKMLAALALAFVFSHRKGLEEEGREKKRL